jgi:hypothetical protein
MMPTQEEISKHKILIYITIIYLIINILLFTPNIKLAFDVKADLEILDTLLDNNINITESCRSEFFSLANYQKTLEERIFNLIFKKFYKKNNSEQ